MNSFSDHFHSVLVERKNQQLKRGKGYWILNSVLLKDDNYIKEIEKLWNDWRSQKHCFSFVSQWWEKGKKHVRNFTKQYTRESTKELNNRKTSLEKQLRNIYALNLKVKDVPSSSFNKLKNIKTQNKTCFRETELQMVNF